MDAKTIDIPAADQHFNKFENRVSVSNEMLKYSF